MIVVVIALEVLGVLLLAASAGLAAWELHPAAGLAAAAVVVLLGAWRADVLTRTGARGAAVRSSERS